MHQDRSLYGARLAATLIISVTTLGACGGGPQDTAPSSGDPALAASKPGELLDYVKDRLRTRLAQRQSTTGGGAPAGLAPALVATVSPAGDAVLRSGSNVQEAGIDEIDLIKSDGTFIYTVDTTARTASGRVAASLQAHRRLPDGRIEPVASLALPDDPDAVPVTHGLHFAESAHRLAVLSESVSFVGGIHPCGAPLACTDVPTILPAPSMASSAVHLQAVDTSASGGLAIAQRLTISGRLLGTRRIGSALYIVTTYAPRLAIETLPFDASSAEREAALALLANGDVLPTLRINGSAPRPLLADTDCYLQIKNAAPGIDVNTITVVDLGSAGLAHRSRCIVGGSEALYMSAQSLYLATTRQGYLAADSTLRYPAEIATDVHKFNLAAADVSYRGSGTVNGHLGWDAQRKSYRMSEHNGDLRVLTFTGELGWFGASDRASLAASPARLTVLRERPAEPTLEPIAHLPNAQRPAPLGAPGEQVHGVRFVGDRGYLVTFRQTDPLYVLDLADPTDPRSVGELKVTGYSDHLLPLPDGLLLGVGRQASESGVLGGVKVALFDVRDPARPQELSAHTFGERGSYTGLDASPQGINVLNLAALARIALPLFIWSTTSTQSQQGLQRFEVNTTARTLTTKPMLQAPGSASAYDLWGDRSLQIGDHVYYLSQGRLGAWAW